MGQEVLYVVAHFVISIFILGAYGYTAVQGHPDETLKNLSFLVGGYWFGAVGKSAYDKATAKKTTGTKP